MGRKIYVGNLSYQTTDESLSSRFQEFGTVESARVITDRETGRSKGFAFIEMSSDTEAAAAVTAMDGQEFEGRNLKVSEARPQENTGRGGGGGGGGRGFGGGGGGGGSRGGGRDFGGGRSNRW